MIFESAIQQDLDVIELCVMSGAHIPVCRQPFRLLHERGAEDVVALVGGAIPSKDILT
jgi:methylmalonyl-CoA mutase C-terminal domain/subunit